MDSFCCHCARETREYYLPDSSPTASSTLLVLRARYDDDTVPCVAPWISAQCVCSAVVDSVVFGFQSDGWLCGGEVNGQGVPFAWPARPVSNLSAMYTGETPPKGFTWLNLIISMD